MNLLILCESLGDGLPTRRNQLIYGMNIGTRNYGAGNRQSRQRNVLQLVVTLFAMTNLNFISRQIELFSTYRQVVADKRDIWGDLGLYQTIQTGERSRIFCCTV